MRKDVGIRQDTTTIAVNDSAAMTVSGLERAVAVFVRRGITNR